MTRYNWQGALALSLALAVAGGTSTFIHEYSINSRDRDIIKAQHENRYVRMIGGDEPLDRSAPGHLARLVKPALEKQNRVASLLKIYVSPADFDYPNGVITTPVISRAAQIENQGGKLTSRFILLTLQAADDPSDVLRRVPEKKNPGFFKYEYAGGLAGIPWIGLLFASMFYWMRDNHAELQKRKKHEAYLASLSPTARGLLKIINELERTKPTYGMGAAEKWAKSAEGRAHKKATEAFELATKGWRDTEQKQRLKALSDELHLIVESEKEGQRAYRELG